MLKGPMDDGKGECITLVSVIALLSATIVVGHALMLIIIGVRAISCLGGGKPFAQKILPSCPNFYETVEKKRGRYDAIT